MTSRVAGCALLTVLALAPLAQALDTIPPAIVADPPKSWTPGSPLIVECQIIDESDPFDPTVYWRVAGSTSWERMPLEADGAVYRASVTPPQDAEALELFIETFDIEGNGPARFGTRDVPIQVEVVRGVVLDVPAKAPTPTPATPRFEPLPDFSTPTTASWRKPTAIGLWVAGAVLAAGGAVAVAVHRSQATEFIERFANEGRYVEAERSGIATLGAVGAGLLATGGVAVVGGTVLYVVEF